MLMLNCDDHAINDISVSHVYATKTPFAIHLRNENVKKESPQATWGAGAVVCATRRVFSHGTTALCFNVL